MRKFFTALFRFLDRFRKLLHLLLLLLIFGSVVSALRGSIPKLPVKAALVLRPVGEIVEQRSTDPIELAISEAQGTGRTETLLRDLTDALRSAKDDERVQAVVLELDAMQGSGQPTLEEFASAISQFKKSGKKVIATSEIGYSRDTYFIAAYADEIYLDPLGLVLIEGYDRYRNYYKSALDKLGIDVNVYKVGIYKSAVEPFLRTDMSAEDREASAAYLSSLWDSYVTHIAQARKLSREDILTYVNTLSPALQIAKGDGAQVALKAHIVTGIKSSLEVEQRVAALVGADEETGGYQSISLEDYLHSASSELGLSKSEDNHVGVIIAAGEIVDGAQSAGVIGGDTMSQIIREARLDKDLKALVLRIDSPGGSVLASEKIYRELLAFRATKRPIVISMGDLAASGGYYIAAPADEIWASPATITGSIGIFGLFPTANRALDKIGVGVDGVGTTPLSGEFRLDRPVGVAASTLIQSVIEHGYEEFLAHVSEGRNKSRDEVHAIAQGRVWAGRDAKRIGLVDNLGSMEDAIKAAAKRANLEEGEYSIDYRDPKLSWAQELAQSIKGSVISWVVKYAGIDLQTSALLQIAHREMGSVEREVLRMNRLAVANRLYAHCFCTAY